MSVEVSAWAWKQDISPTKKLVLLALADHADNCGEGWAKVPRVVKKTGLSKTSVYREIAELKELGFMVEDKGVWRLTVPERESSIPTTGKKVPQRDADSHSGTPIDREPSSNHQLTEGGLSQSETKVTYDWFHGTGYEPTIELAP